MSRLVGIQIIANQPIVMYLYWLLVLDQFALWIMLNQQEKPRQLMEKELLKFLQIKVGCLRDLDQDGNSNGIVV